MRWPATRLIVIGDNLYAKAQLAQGAVEQSRGVLVSRRRNTAALSLLPPRKPRLVSGPCGVPS